MGVWLHLGDLPPVRCLSYRHQVVHELTRDRRRADPRVPGRSRHEDFAITKDLDSTTPLLLRACAEGRVLPAVVVQMRRPPEDADPDAPPPPHDEERPGFVFALEDVIVTSVLTSVEDSGPLETVSLSYSRVVWRWEGDDEPVSESWHVHGASS